MVCLWLFDDESYAVHACVLDLIHVLQMRDAVRRQFRMATQVHPHATNRHGSRRSDERLIDLKWIIGEGVGSTGRMLVGGRLGLLLLLLIVLEHGPGRWRQAE